MKTLTEIRAEFSSHFADRFGGKVAKTAWHFVNWVLTKDGQYAETVARAKRRAEIMQDFGEWAKEQGVVASWENCARYCAEKGLINE